MTVLLEVATGAVRGACDHRRARSSGEKLIGFPPDLLALLLRSPAVELPMLLLKA
jgi:hypothetical protein